MPNIKPLKVGDYFKSRIVKRPKEIFQYLPVKQQQHKKPKPNNQTKNQDQEQEAIYQP